MSPSSSSRADYNHLSIHRPTLTLLHRRRQTNGHLSLLRAGSRHFYKERVNISGSPSLLPHNQKKESSFHSSFHIILPNDKKTQLSPIFHLPFCVVCNLNSPSTTSTTSISKDRPPAFHCLGAPGRLTD